MTQPPLPEKMINNPKGPTIELNCWLCDEPMTTYTYQGQVWCCFCDVIYTNGVYIHTFGVGVPYVLFKNKRYLMDVWERMLKLKAFW